MRIDDPAAVSAKIIVAIKQRKKDVCIGFPEYLVARFNALLPRIIDSALAGNARKAKKLFAS
jgi:short-subunit dehydrogenase